MSAKTTKANSQPQNTTILLIRHGENEWTETHKLAGRTPGVHLNQQGQKQAEALAKRLSTLPLNAIYASPLERTMETAQAIAGYHNLTVIPNRGLLEVNYGKWTGKAIKKLARKKRWQLIQHQPTRAKFPGGESMLGMQARMIDQINRLADEHTGRTVAVVGHADLIKAAVAHYLGVHFDLFQRIVISTASITAITFTPHGPRVFMVNDTSHNPARSLLEKDQKRK